VARAVEGRLQPSDQREYARVAAETNRGVVEGGLDLPCELVDSRANSLEVSGCRVDLSPRRCGSGDCLVASDSRPLDVPVDLREIALKLL
jgi:hypothetical protein